MAHASLVAASSAQGVSARKRSYVTPGVSAEAKRTAEAQEAGAAADRSSRSGASKESRHAHTTMSNEEFFQGGGYEAEKARQDEDLDELGGMVKNLKSLSVALGTELEAQSGQIEDFGDDVERTGDRIKRAAKQAGKLAGNRSTF
uniref:t-SNARE coiled-coil homology domain-containing protein n=1 Tax=Prasinoderma singulare TaxID=676789 RepID=A0A7S3BK98_9VIRI|mmetsp:Transcript_18012/g.55904  ORF Transcript_18012/g.55904 Transcript_18012/m.55904 type:complete len:145 (+) Transcript_18012:323-757(+)